MSGPTPDPRLRRPDARPDPAVAVRATPPTVLLYHGAAGSPRVWDRVVRRLAPDVACCPIDLQGLGFEAAEPRVVVGNGVGSLVAARVARENASVRGVVMTGPVGLAGSGHARLGWLSTRRGGAALLRLAGCTVARRRFLRDQLAHPDRDEEPARILVDALVAARRFHLLARLNRPASLAPLRDLRCPVTVLWGERDGVLPVTRADEFMSHLPRHATLTIVPDAAHALPLERSDLVAAAVRALA